MTDKQPPCTRFVFPPIRKPALDCLPGEQTRARGVADGLNTLEAHDDDEGSIVAGNSISRSNVEKLMMPALPNVSRTACLPTTTWFVGSFENEVLGPQPFQGRTIALTESDTMILMTTDSVLPCGRAEFWTDHRCTALARNQEAVTDRFKQPP